MLVHVSLVIEIRLIRSAMLSSTPYNRVNQLVQLCARPGPLVGCVDLLFRKRKEVEADTRKQLQKIAQIS